MKQIALGFLIETCVPVAVGLGLVGYIGFRAARGAWREFVR